MLEQNEALHLFIMQNLISNFLLFKFFLEGFDLKNYNKLKRSLFLIELKLLANYCILCDAPFD